MRKMADSIVAGNCPVGFDLYAGYDDGRYMDVDAIKALHPDKPVVAVTVFPSDNEGIVLDVEPGNATPQQAPAWVVMRRKAGVDPTVYCSESDWAACKDAFAASGVPEPHWWIAGYPGSVGEALYPGAVAHQWIDRGPYDESVVADYWPGVDPAPSPVPAPTPPTKEENETVTTWEDLKPDGTVALRHVTGVVNGKAYHWWQPPGGNATGPKWSVEELQTP